MQTVKLYMKSGHVITLNGVTKIEGGRRLDGNRVLHIEQDESLPVEMIFMPLLDLAAVEAVTVQKDN